MNKLIGFDGVRAIACLIVIFHHFAQRINPSYVPEWMSPLIQIAWEFNIGVSIFFVLSGALLSYPYWKSFINNTEIPSTKIYIKRRIARIAPAYYLNMTVAFFCSFLFLDAVLDSQLIIRYLVGFTFLSGLHPVTLFPTEANDPLWSISFEVVSYGFLLIVMYGLFKIIKNRSFSDALYYLVFVMFLGILLHVVYYKFFPIINEGRGWQHGRIGGALTWMPATNIISLFLHFLFGMIASALMVFLFHKKQTANKGFDYFLLVNWVFFIAYAYFQRGDTFFNIPYYFPFFPMLIGITLICLPFTVFSAKYLDNRFFLFTAKISFGLYIWHMLIMALIQRFIFEQYEVFETQSLTIYFVGNALTLIFSYALASISFYLIEQPVQKWSQRTK